MNKQIAVSFNKKLLENIANNTIDDNAMSNSNNNEIYNNYNNYMNVNLSSNYAKQAKKSKVIDDEFNSSGEKLVVSIPLYNYQDNNRDDQDNRDNETECMYLDEKKQNNISINLEGEFDNEQIEDDNKDNNNISDNNINNNENLKRKRLRRTINDYGEIDEELLLKPKKQISNNIRSDKYTQRIRQSVNSNSFNNHNNQNNIHKTNGNGLHMKTNNTNNSNNRRSDRGKTNTNTTTGSRSMRNTRNKAVNYNEKQSENEESQPDDSDSNIADEDVEPSESDKLSNEEYEEEINGNGYHSTQQSSNKKDNEFTNDRERAYNLRRKIK